MNKSKEEEEIIIEWARKLTNPMFSTHGAVREIYPNAYGIDSTYSDYKRVYGILERMVKKGILMCHGTVNGGNIYLLRERVK